MQTHLLLETDAAFNAKYLLRFLKTLPHVKSAVLESKNRKNKRGPLTVADWVRPGRPATEEELENLADEMDKEKGGFTTAELKKRMRLWKAKHPA